MNDGSCTSHYDFTLPPSQIAQSPAAERDASRLMLVDRASGAIRHLTFRDLPSLIAAGDVLVRNTTRVMRARLLGTRVSGGRAEVFLLRPLGDHRWEAMVHPGAKLKPGRRIVVGPDLSVVINETTPAHTRVVTLETSLDDDVAIEQYGHVPLPPYIQRTDSAPDAERYQTVYANERGSVAAPTAGLHFTPDLLATLSTGGVKQADVVLHVGAGTFKPVSTDDPGMHPMHAERFFLSAAAADIVNDTRGAGGRSWAVGTTSVRVLESAAGRDGRLVPMSGETRIFLRPPYAFRAVDRLITNFHLPRSTLLMLVAAFAGYDLTMHAYDQAVRAGYRFYSYGDAMVIV